MTSDEDKENVPLLPDLCSTAATLALILIAALVAIALAAARTQLTGFWADLGRLALLCEFLTLTSAAALCALRRLPPTVNQALVLTLAFAVLIGINWGIAEAAWYLLAAFGEALPSGASGHLLWVCRIVIVAVIVDALVLRYLYVSAKWRERVRRAATSRLEALTARIRPHFLFNTLNTAAALAADHPEETERTLEDLSELFRANLAEHGPRIRLADEIALVRRYLAIEQRRLGERLRLRWQLDPNIEEARIPALLLQPLVENAVTHGIEPLAAGGDIRIEIRHASNRLEIAVNNPAGKTHGEGGHGIGLAGVRARLALAFNGEANLKTLHQNGRFSAEIHCPWQTEPHDNAHSHSR